jgi:hypothetical protein
MNAISFYETSFCFTGTLSFFLRRFNLNLFEWIKVIILKLKMRSLNGDFHITEKHNYIKLCETVALRS